MDEPQAKQVWAGSIGQTSLRVELLPSGRIAATWRVGGSERRSVVDTVEQFERSVLFQLMLSAPPNEDKVAGEVLAAIMEGKQGMPDPSTLPRSRRRKPAGRARPRRPHRR